MQASAEDAPPRRKTQNTITTQQSEIDVLKETSAQVKQEGVLTQASVGEVVNILHNAFLTQYGSVEGFEASESREKINYLTKLYETKQKYEEMGAPSGFASSLFNMWVSALVDNNKLLEKETGKELDYFGKIAAGIDDSQSEESITQMQTINNDAYEQNVKLFKTQDIDINDDTDEVDWEQALAEFEGDSRRPGLWAKSFAYAQGDETLAKAIYLKQRAIELHQEREEQELTNKIAKTFDGKKFYFQHISYDTLGDAVNYARKISHISKEESDEIESRLCDEKLMNEFGIITDGEKYHFQQYRYDCLSDAIKYVMNIYDKHSYSPLINAVKKGDLNLIRCLLTYGADPKIAYGIFGTTTALSMAIVSLNGAKDQQTRNTYQSIIDILKPIS